METILILVICLLLMEEEITFTWENKEWNQ